MEKHDRGSGRFGWLTSTESVVEGEQTGDMATQIVTQIGTLLNSTVQAASYAQVSSFGSASQASNLTGDLHMGYDWNSLSTLEQWWARWVRSMSSTKD